MHFSLRIFTRPGTLVLIGLLLAATMLGGCTATRLVRKPIIDRTGVHADLVSEVSGFTTEPRHFAHPAVISTSRLTHILNAIEIETRSESGGTVRQPAFHRDIIEATALAIAEAMAVAGVDQEISIQIVRKQMQLGVFHRKFLTTFLAHMEDDNLYLSLNYVDWPIPKSKEGERLVKPRHDARPMKFRVVGGEHLFFAGPQTLEIAWQNPVFKKSYQLPGSTKGSTRRREILDQSPIPQHERDEADRRQAGGGIEDLSPTQLRALADLEEDRGQGNITEAAYQRAKRQLLRQR